MKKAAADVPDAWDDDWETQADSFPRQDAPPQQTSAPLTKAERLEQHVEANRKLWESASDTPQTFHYLEANSDIPLASTFKPQVKVLSRKPVVAKDPVTGLARLALDDDAEQSDKREAQLTPEQIRAKQKRDREEKQRRYDEARAKIFGESASSSRGSSPGTVTRLAQTAVITRATAEAVAAAEDQGTVQIPGSRSPTFAGRTAKPARRESSTTRTTRQSPNSPPRDEARKARHVKPPPPRDEPQQPIRALR